jgi:hypothetical protein
MHPAFDGRRIEPAEKDRRHQRHYGEHAEERSALSIIHCAGRPEQQHHEDDEARER